LVDQPRRGRASRSTVPMNLTAAPDEQLWFGIFRLGVWPNFFPGVQFAPRPEALDQFFRQIVPNTGPFDADASAAAVAALFDKIGPGILVTHSQSGGLGWRTAIQKPNEEIVMRHTPDSSFNMNHNLPTSDLPNPQQVKLLTTYITETNAFTLAFSTSQPLRTPMASARTFFTFRHYITPSARNF